MSACNDCRVSLSIQAKGNTPRCYGCHIARLRRMYAEETNPRIRENIKNMGIKISKDR